MLNKIRNLRNYLAYQIFLSFMIIIATVFAIALVLPNFDARVFNHIELGKRLYFEEESRYTEEHYNLDDIFQKNLSVTTPNRFDIILLEQGSNRLVGVNKQHLNALQAFIYKANSPAEPLQRRFGKFEFYGPFFIKSDTRNYYQYFVQKVSPQRDFINYMFDSPWMMILLLLIVSTPIMLWLSRRIAKPVKKLRLSANAVATGNLTTNPQLEQEGIMELRQVGKSFNQMITALQRLTGYQQRLLSDISHELKTPLTRMQLALSLLRRRNGESSEITRIEGEIQKLDTMIHDLLMLSRNQANHHLKREIFPIAKIWEDVLADAQFELEQNELTLFVSQRIAHPERYFINGNVAMLASAVENVIRNAKKYTATTVKVTIYLDQKNLFITIDDNGAGVPDSQYTEIFRPFYRVEEDRARQTGGTGLGLAIVANAIQQHRGSVSAEKSEMGGLKVKIQLPLWLE